MPTRTPWMRTALLIAVSLSFPMTEAVAEPRYDVDCLSYQPPKDWTPAGSKTGAAVVWKSNAVVNLGKITHQPNFSIRVMPTDTPLDTFKEQMDYAMQKQREEMITMLKAQQTGNGMKLDLATLSTPKWSRRTYGRTRAWQVDVDSRLKMDGKTVPFSGRTVLVQAGGKMFVVSGGYPSQHAKTLAPLSKAFLASLDFGGCRTTPPKK